jgi:hypothetical protein
MIAVWASFDSVDTDTLATIFIIHKQLSQCLAFFAFSTVWTIVVQYKCAFIGFSLHRSECSIASFLTVLWCTILATLTESLGFYPTTVYTHFRWFSSGCLYTLVIAITTNTQSTIYVRTISSRHRPFQVWMDCIMRRNWYWHTMCQLLLIS